MPIAQLPDCPAAVRCRPDHQCRIPAWNSGFPALPAFRGLPRIGSRV